MGILLVGVVAALFFRNEPLAVDDGLSARREQALNQQLEDRDVAVYNSPEASELSPDEAAEPQWTLSELFEQARKPDSVPAPIGIRPASPPANGRIGPAIGSRESVQFVPPAGDWTTQQELATSSEPSSVQDNALSIEDVLTADGSGRNTDRPGKDQPFDEYTVRIGDTLSEISERFLGTQTRYREIYEMNRDRIESPDRLKIGKAIRVPRVLR